MPPSVLLRARVPAILLLLACADLGAAASAPKRLGVSAVRDSAVTDVCNEDYSFCETCLVGDRYHCGWCETQSDDGAAHKFCYTGTADGPKNASNCDAAAGGVWRFAGEGNGDNVPALCAAAWCPAVTDCATCNATSNCTWCGDATSGSCQSSFYPGCVSPPECAPVSPSPSVSPSPPASVSVTPSPGAGGNATVSVSPSTSPAGAPSHNATTHSRSRSRQHTHSRSPSHSSSPNASAPAAHRARGKAAAAAARAELDA